MRRSQEEKIKRIMSQLDKELAKTKGVESYTLEIDVDNTIGEQFDSAYRVRDLFSQVFGCWSTDLSSYNVIFRKHFEHKKGK